MRSDREEIIKEVYECIGEAEQYLNKKEYQKAYYKCWDALSLMDYERDDDTVDYDFVSENYMDDIIDSRDGQPWQVAAKLFQNLKKEEDLKYRVYRTIDDEPVLSFLDKEFIEEQIEDIKEGMIVFGI